MRISSADIRRHSRPEYTSIVVFAICCSVVQRWLSLGPYLRISSMAYMGLAFFCIYLMVANRLPKPTLSLPRALCLALIVYISISTGFRASEVNIFHPILFIVFYTVAVFVLPQVIAKVNANHLYIVPYFFAQFAFLSDFLSSNLFGFPLSGLLQTSEVSGFSEVRERAFFLTPSGPAEEPGDMAFYLSLFFPFVAAHLTNLGKLKSIIGLAIFHIGTIFLLSSAAGLALFPLSFIGAAILFLALGGGGQLMGRLLAAPNRIIGLMAVVLAGGAALALTAPLVLKGVDVGRAFGGIILKWQLSTGSVSASARLSNWYVGSQQLDSHPIFGVGFGYNSENYGRIIQNLYLLLGAETGMTGLSIYIALVASVMWCARRHFGALWAMAYFLMHSAFIGDITNFPAMFVIASCVAFSEVRQVKERTGAAEVRLSQRWASVPAGRQLPR